MIPYKRAAIAMAFLPLASAGYAADAEPVNNGTLPSVTITGNWLGDPSEAKVLEHPGARSIVERQRFQESGSSNVRDVLRQIPGVQVQDSNGTGGSDVSLNVGVRGLTSRFSPRSTALMDGVPLAFAPYGQPQLSLAPLALGNLEAIDVVRGAGSVRYGPQNVGGIINFVTRSIPKDFAAEASINTDFASHGGGVKSSPSMFIGGTNENGLGVAVLYSGTHGEGFRTDNTRTNIDDILFKSAYRISKTDDIAFSLHHYEGSGLMPGGLTSAQYAANPFQSVRQYDEFSGRRTDGSLKYTHKDGVNNFELLTYYTDTFRGSHLEQEGSGTSAGRMRLTTAPRSYNVFAVEPRYSRLFAGDKVVQEVSVGYRYLKENSSEVAGRTAYYTPNTGVDVPNLPIPTYQTSSGGTVAHAFYIDNRIDIGNWTITPGVRYEYIRTHNDVTNFNTNGTVSSALYPKVDAHEALPTLAVMYRMNERWSVFANAGVSFGPQQYSQLASTTVGLHPEKATTYEIGTHFKGEALSGEVTIFNIDFNKELLLNRSIVGEGQWTDLGATRHRGIETALRYQLADWNPALKGLSTSATYTYTQATQNAGDFQGRDLPFYSRQVGSVGVRYERNRWILNADVFAQSKQNSPGSGPQYITAEDTSGRLGRIPGWSTTNLRAAYDFGKSANNLKLAVGVKNLFDRRYFTRSTDNNGGKYVGQPRTLYVQASVAY